MNGFADILGAIGAGADAAATALSGDLSTAVRIVAGLARVGRAALARLPPEQVIEMLDWLAANPARKASSKPAEDLLTQILKDRRNQNGDT